MKNSIILKDEYKPIETLWTISVVNGDSVKYVSSFGVEYIPKEIKKKFKKICWQQKYRKCRL